MKHRGRPAACLKRTPSVTVIAAVLLCLGWTSNILALMTSTTSPAGFALIFACSAFLLLLVFQP